MTDYHLMMNGGRPEGCTCAMIADVQYGAYGEPQEPACWVQNPDCPVHPAEPAREGER